METHPYTPSTAASPPSTSPIHGRKSTLTGWRRPLREALREPRVGGAAHRREVGGHKWAVGAEPRAVAIDGPKRAKPLAVGGTIPPEQPLG